MGNSNAKKAATLGMPSGTASGKLRKIILFHLLCKLKENVCFKCGADIQRVEDLSIEHKLPWEGISAELFWDLENIAFSHILCNRPHTNHGGAPLRKIAPEGTAWCSGCQKFLSRDYFWNDKSRWNGLTVYCKVCKDAHKTDR